MQQQPLHVPYLLVLPSASHPGCLPKQQDGMRYVRDGVKSTLCCMGVKNRHAIKIAQQVFLRAAAHLPELAKPQHRRSSALANWSALPHGSPSSGEVCISLPRAEFYELLCSCLAEHNYKCTPSSEELRVACSLRERRKCVVVLICGTSGSGKSTLASILANRLGITTVISTDSVRHMLRSFATQEEAPLLYASTYQAGDSLPIPNGNGTTNLEQSDKQQSSHTTHQQEQGVRSSDLERAILGYKAQCEPVVHKLDVLISDFEARKQSLVIEGVHLSISLVIKLMQRHPSVIPFLVYIKSEAKHMERMAVRAKYMTLDPQKNRYVAHMHCIRWIQDYLVRKADLHLIPKVENSNVDQSVGLIHVALTGTLKRTLHRGEPVQDPKTNTVRVLHAELRAAAESLSTTSKAMVEQVRLSEAAHAASASAPLPSWPSDSETIQGSTTTKGSANYATTDAFCPLLDVSLSRGHPNGSTEHTLHVVGSSSLASVSAPRPSEGPCPPLNMLSPVGSPAATGLLHQPASDADMAEGTAPHQPHWQPLHHQQQQQQQQQQPQGKSMPGPQTLGLAAAAAGASPSSTGAGGLSHASPLLPAIAMGGKSASCTCLYSRDGTQELRPLSACCASTGVCHIPRMTAALTTPPKDTMQAAKQVKAARAQSIAAGSAGTSHAPPVCCAIRPSTDTKHGAGPLASSGAGSKEQRLQHGCQASTCNHHAAPTLMQQPQAAPAEEPRSCGLQDTSHVDSLRQPSSHVNPIGYPQQQQQQQQELGAMDGESHSTSSSACHLSSSRSAAIEDGEARDTFTMDSLLALPQRTSSRTGLSHKHANLHSHQHLHQSPFLLLPLSPNQAHKQQPNQQHHAASPLHAMRPNHQPYLQQQQYHPQHQQQQPWRSSRWIGRRGGKHAPKFAHPGLPPQSSPFSSQHAAHGAVPTGANPQGTATINSLDARVAAASRPCLLNSDDDDDDEALAAMCCAEASGGRPKGVPRLLNVGSQGSLELGAANTAMPGHYFGVQPSWAQRPFVMGNSSAAESEVEPSFMLMGYGSLAETYDEFTEDGEDLQSQHSSTKHSSLIARLQRSGSSHGARVGEHAALCSSSSVGASPQQQQQPPSLPPPPMFSSGSTAPVQASSEGHASDPIAGSGQRGGMGDTAHSGDGASNAVAADESGLGAKGGSTAAGCGHHSEQGVQHHPGATTGRSAEEEANFLVQQQEQQQQQGVPQLGPHGLDGPAPQLVLRSSNSTIVRHLAGAMARSKMRATANSTHLPSYPAAPSALVPPSSADDTCIPEAGGLSVQHSVLHNHCSHAHLHGSAPFTPSNPSLPSSLSPLLAVPAVRTAQTPTHLSQSSVPATQLNTKDVSSCSQSSLTPSPAPVTAASAGSSRLAGRRGSSFNAHSTAAHSQHSPRSKSSLSRHSYGHPSHHHQHSKAYHTASRSMAAAGEGSSSRESLTVSLDMQQEQTHSLAAAEELLRCAGAHIKPSSSSASSRPSR